MRARRAAIVVAILLVLGLATLAVGADPSAVPVEVLEGGDLRSEGEGPGLVGNPLLILVAVVGLGLATAGATVVVVRLRDRA